MEWLAYISCVILYGLYSHFGFSQEIRESQWFIPLGLTCAVLANVAWMLLVRHLGEANSILTATIRWDALIIGVSLLIPLVFHQVRLSGFQWVGMGFMLTGFFLTKIGA